MKRRTLFAMLISLPAIAYAKWLDPQSPTAKALGYVNISMTPGQSCKNCIQYQPQGNKCNLFPGQEVYPTAWCKVWVKKP